MNWTVTMFLGQSIQPSAVLLRAMEQQKHQHHQQQQRSVDVRNALSSLITKRQRDVGDAFSLMKDYLKILQLEEPLAKLSVIHVAGTKGKGSTCAFTESILRTCGYRTGLFTSPHLVDVRERFRFDGIEVPESTFEQHFWACWDRLKDGCKDKVPMPSYFRFLTLLAFKMFVAEKVDVAILEVGLGGKYDPTNLVPSPDVCGITSLGFDHMEMLGHTLPEIAGEKAGIFKPGVPAFTALQRQDAMAVLQQRASELSIPFKVVHPLDLDKIGDLQLGLRGDHQLMNAALAVALCNTWIEKRGNPQLVARDDGCLPESYKQGLANTQLSGRAQIEHDSVGNLTFYLDGAHSPESMEACAKWFCKTIKGANGVHSNTDPDKAKQIMLFNCMAERDPQLLFPPLLNTCLQHGIHIHKAFFVPEEKANGKPDLSWQYSLQRNWDAFQEKTARARGTIKESQDTDFLTALIPENASATSFSLVVPSLSVALESLRRSARQHPSVPVQVVVTGSLHLVGDVLRLLKR